MSDGDGFDAGPFSMMAVSALENHVDTIEFLGKKYAAVKLGDEVEGGANLTTCMIFCRGLLGYDSRQRVILRDMAGGGQEVKPGDWIVMVSRTEYTVFRMHGNESLFSLMPDTPRSTYWARLSRIAAAHKKEVLDGGTTSGMCVECYQTWDEKAGGCPTKVWATTDRDILATWDPADDETPEGVGDEV